ncbi:MAG: hypothetical protein VB031_02685 [Eubacteriaceae bacterium]|nr:hypothetical protein [Eubacteriaceae bacterium]
MDKIIISHQTYDPVQAYLESRGVSLVRLRPFSGVDPAVSCHPDMRFCKLGAADDAPVFAGSKKNLGPSYPEDIIYNAACTGRYFIHALRYTSKDLLQTARDMSMIFVDVKQGYSKCSTLIVDEDSVITSDRGMCGPMKKAGLDVLLISEGHILLPGHDHGFIGGSTGRIGGEIVFNGDIDRHPDGTAIRSFITSRKTEIRSFPGLPLMDIGSIIPI